MLAVFKRIVFFISYLSACLWSPLTANGYMIHTAVDNPTDLWLKQADYLKHSLDTKEMIRIIVQLRDYMISKGCYFPRLTEFLDTIRDALTNEGLEIEEGVFEALKAEFESYEQNRRCSVHEIKHHKKKHHKKDKEIKVNSKTAVGFIKFMAGSLLCFVPIPMVQSAGLALAVIGASEMADGAREQADKKDWDDRMEANRQVDHGLDQR